VGVEREDRLDRWVEAHQHNHRGDHDHDHGLVVGDPREFEELCGRVHPMSYHFHGVGVVVLCG
jgi:hypothetical protein